MVPLLPFVYPVRGVADVVMVIAEARGGLLIALCWCSWDVTDDLPTTSRYARGQCDGVTSVLGLCLVAV